MDGVSLLNFLDTPFMVIDPDGFLVYVNPSFQMRFCPDGEEVEGQPLVALFEGGGREAILNAVADVCEKGQTMRFRMREGTRGYLGLACPIEAPGAEAGRLGVVILLNDEPAIDAKLQSVHREIQEPLDEAVACLEQLIDQTGGRRDEQFRGAVERGMTSLIRAKKWSEELGAVLGGRLDRVAIDARFDPVRLIHEVGTRVSDLMGDGVKLDLLVPAQLPAASGDGDVLEAALVRLLRLRVAKAQPGSGVTLAARTMGSAEGQALLVTVIDQPRAGEDNDEREPHSLSEAVAPHGGRVHTIRLTGAGRATSLRLPLA